MLFTNNPSLGMSKESGKAITRIRERVAGYSVRKDPPATIDRTLDARRFFLVRLLVNGGFLIDDGVSSKV